MARKRSGIRLRSMLWKKVWQNLGISYTWGGAAGKKKKGQKREWHALKPASSRRGAKQGK